MGKLGIIKNDNAIIDEFAIASWQATRRLKDRFEAIIFSLIRDYQKRELSGFREMKKKNLTSTIRDKVADGKSQRARRRSAGALLLWKLMLMVDCMMRARKYLRWNIDLNENIVRIFLRFLNAI